MFTGIDAFRDFCAIDCAKHMPDVEMMVNIAMSLLSTVILFSFEALAKPPAPQRLTACARAFL